MLETSILDLSPQKFEFLYPRLSYINKIGELQRGEYESIKVSKGTAHKTEELSGVFQTKMDLHLFPFDVQGLPIIMRYGSSSSRCLVELMDMNGTPGASVVFHPNAYLIDYTIRAPKVEVTYEQKVQLCRIFPLFICTCLSSF